MSIAGIFKKLFGTKADRDMKAIMPKVKEVLAAYETIDKLTDDELRAKCDELKAIIQNAIAEDEKRIAEIKLELEKDLLS
jgi:preprotein translocase subunit SecA